MYKTRVCCLFRNIVDNVTKIVLFPNGRFWPIADINKSIFITFKETKENENQKSGPDRNCSN
jgi:hypothetical protein